MLDGEIFLAIHRAGRAKPDSVRRPPDRGQGQWLLKLRTRARQRVLHSFSEGGSAALASALRCRPSTHRPSDPNYRVRGHYRQRKDECDLARSRNVRQRNHCMFAMPHAIARVRPDLPESFAGISCKRLSRGLASRSQAWGDAVDAFDPEI